MELEQAVENVLSFVGEITDQPTRYKLVLLVGQDEDTRSSVIVKIIERTAYSRLDAGLMLSKRLLPIPETRRPLKASSEFKAIANEQLQQKTVLVIDNIGILFDTSLQLSPLDLLEDISRFIPLIVSWPGSIAWNKDGTIHSLTHAGPDDGEYKCYNHVHTSAVVDLNMESAQ